MFDVDLHIGPLSDGSQSSDEKPSVKKAVSSFEESKTKKPKVPKAKSFLDRCTKAGRIGPV